MIEPLVKVGLQLMSLGPKYGKFMLERIREEGNLLRSELTQLVTPFAGRKVQKSERRFPI